MKQCLMSDAICST